MNTLLNLTTIFLISMFTVPVYGQNKIEDADIKLWRKIGVSYYLEFNYEEAIDKFNFVLKHKKDDIEAFYMRGLSKATTGDYWGAVKDLASAIELDPSKAEYRYRHGRYLYKINKNNKAIISLKKAQELEPNNPVYFYYGAACLKKLGDKNGMCKDLMAAADLKLAKAQSLFNIHCAPFMK